MRLVICSILVFSSCKIFAAPFKDLPGCFPLQYERQAASDLNFQEKTLLPDEARKLYESGKVKDLSTLNPITSSVLWKDDFPKQLPNDIQALKLNLSDDQVEFVAEDIVPNGRIGFIAQKRFADGQIKTFRFLLDLKGHNILLRKTLLRKIGYNIPAVERVAKVRVRFGSAFKKREFVREIKRKTFIESERWVTSNPETQDDELTFQDLVVIDNFEDSFYLLARGDMNSGIIRGRRLINSLLAPFALTDVPQSLNLFSPLPGRISNTQYCLPYEDADQFNPPFEDMRWITRRMLQLKRQDWEEIVKSADLPYEVSLVLTEKLLSRRNALREALKLENESSEIPAQLGITSGERLINGKLIGKKWTGYAREFAGTDPNSPLSSEEIIGLIKSIGLSNAIANTVSEFNSRFLPRTDLGWEILDRQLDVSARQFGEFIRTGTVTPTPRGLWSTPYYNSNIIASRDILSGNYLGTENLVQIADTVGFAVDGGLFALGEGFPANVSVSGRAKIAFVKTYQHIKPLKSIRAGLAEPFKNIMVPALVNNAIAPLDKIESLRKSVLELTPEQREEDKDGKIALLKEEMEKFRTLFGVGDSLITSTSLAPGIEFRIGKGLSSQADLALRMQNDLIGISRVHIFHKDNNTVQVYIDPAAYNNFSITLGLNFHIPIIELGYKRIDGVAEINYFNIDINPDLDKNPKFFDNLLLVQAAMRGASLDYLKSELKPWQVKHDFSEHGPRFRFLHWNYLKSTFADDIKVIHPEGSQRDFLRRSRGIRTGKDYQTVALDLTNELIQEKLDRPNFQIRTGGNGNPGDTILGSSISRMVTVDSEMNNSLDGLEKLFAGIGYRWKGWQISRKNLDKVLDDIRQMFGRDIFARPVLHNTEKVQFYQVQVQVSLYRRAFEHLLTLTNEDIKRLFLKYEKRPQYNSGEVQSTDLQNGWIVSMQKDLKKMKRSMASGNRRDMVYALNDILDVAETQLEFQGVIELVGGEKNFFARGMIQGFRVGTETGDQSITSPSIGEVGSYDVLGPLNALQGQMGIAGGEFFINWIVNPL